MIWIFLTYSNKLLKTICISRGSRLDVFLAKDVLKNAANLQENTQLTLRH